MSRQDTLRSSNGYKVTDDIFNLEQTIMTNLADFNNKYRLFLTCAQTPNVNRPNFDKSICNPSITTEDLKNNLTDVYGTLKTNVELLTSRINSIKTNKNSIGSDEHINNYYIIKNMYDKVVQDRRELDSSLTELYEIGDTTNTFYQTQLVRTSYMKIMLLIVASSLTFAAFMTMRNNNK